MRPLTESVTVRLEGQLRDSCGLIVCRNLLEDAGILARLSMVAMELKLAGV